MSYWLDDYMPLIYNAKDKTNKKIAKIKNGIEFQNVFARLLTDALNRYKIEGLPDGCDERVILQSLVRYGSVIFFEREGSIMALPGSATEDFNVYGNPKHGWVWGRNGWNERVRLYIPGADDNDFLRIGVSGESAKQDYRAVFVRENAICYPFLNYVVEFSLAISDGMRTLDVCRANIKQPFIVVAEEAIVNSVKEFFKARNDNVEYVVSSGVFPSDKISLLPFETNADNLKNCTDTIEWYYNQWRELCGLQQNSNPDKKERLLVDEVNAGNQSSEVQIDKCMKYIQEGLDQCNKIWGLNMKVMQTIEATEENKEEEEEEEEKNNYGNDDI